MEYSPGRNLELSDRKVGKRFAREFGDDSSDTEGNLEVVEGQGVPRLGGMFAAG